MMLERVSPGPIGFEHRLFECPRCNHVETRVIASDPFKSIVTGWFAGELRTPNWQRTSREERRARYSKPGSAMYGLRFSNEIDGDWAGHAGPRLANVCLPTMQEGSAAHHRKRRDRGVASAEELAGPSRQRPPAPWWNS